MGFIVKGPMYLYSSLSFLSAKFSFGYLQGSSFSFETKNEQRKTSIIMDASKRIEHEIGGLKNDALRFGLQGVKSDIVGSHPLESAFQSVHSLHLARLYIMLLGEDL